MMNSIYIMAGGPVAYIPQVDQYEEPAIWIGADKGVSTLVSMGITPNIVFGDFDSVAEADLQWVRKQNAEIHQYPSEKDDTDLGLALEWALAQKPDIIRIFGNTGGRMDHTMAGIQLILKNEILKSDVHIEIIDQRNCMYALLPGTYKAEKLSQYKYISFIPITTEVKGITLTGFKYPLDKKDINLGSNLCISNELISQIGTFSFTDGILLVIRSND